MEFRPFEHAALLGEAWRRGPPSHNLGASAFVPDDPLHGLPRELVPEDVAMFDLHVQTAYRDAVAGHLGVDADMVRPTAGTSAANTAVIAAALRPGSRVVTEMPSYAPLWQAAEGFGGRIEPVQRDAAGALDVDALIGAIDGETSLVLLTSPHNPTGDVASDAALLQIAEAAAEVGATVLVDQVYRELTDQSIAATLHPAIVSTGSLNKCWGAPGLRAGWAVGEPGRMGAIEEVHRILSLGPSSPGTRLGVALIAQRDERRRQLEARLAATHPIYEAWARTHGLDARHGALTAFPKLDVDTRALHERAAGRGILLLPGEVFGRPGHVRIGLGIAPGPLQAGLDALGALL